MQNVTKAFESARIQRIRTAYAEQAEAFLHKRSPGYYVTYRQAIQDFRGDLEALKNSYCSHNLGFNLIRILHRKKGTLSPDGKTCLIRGMEFSEENTQNPKLSESSKRDYAALFTALAMESEKHSFEEAQLAQLFQGIFYQNTYRGHFAEKADIIELAFLLALDIDETTALMLRTLQNDGFSIHSTADLIAMFCISAPSLTLSDAASLQAEYLRRKPKSAVVSAVPRPVGITQRVYNRFETELLDNAATLSREPAYHLCLNWLLANAPQLDAPSQSAAAIYRELILLVHKEWMRLESAPDIRPEADLYNAVKGIRVKDASPPLTADHILQITRDLFEETDNVIQDHNSWAYPGIGPDGNLARFEIGSRVTGILSGSRDFPVQKNDILFALFLACGLRWNRMAPPQTFQDLQIRYRRFIQLAKELLLKAHLPGFYLLAPFEYTATQAIMSGDDPLQFYKDMLFSSSLSGKSSAIIPAYSVEAKKQRGSYNIDRQNIAALSAEERKKYLALERVFMNCAQKPRTAASQNPLICELRLVAEQIAIYWSRKQFCPLTVLFESDSKKIRVSERSGGTQIDRLFFLCDMPDEIHRVLSGSAPLNTTFEIRAKERATIQKKAKATYGLNLEEEQLVLPARQLYAKVMLYVIIGILTRKYETQVYMLNAKAQVKHPGEPTLALAKVLQH